MNLTSIRLGWLLFLATSTAGFAQTAPVITSISAPRQIVSSGLPLMLMAVATGTPVPTYQWKHNGRPIPAATSQIYTIANASPSTDNGWYQVVVANSSGTTTSPVIFVNVGVYPAQVLTSGNFEAPQSAVPADLNNVSGVAAGAGHWLALKVDGTVTAWGNNAYGQSTVPAGLNNVVGIAASNYCSFALNADGTVVAWGDGSFQATAVPAGLKNVVSITAGQSHALALKSDGTVVAWGWNVEGQASPPPGLSNVIGISAGQNNSFAWRADGTAVGWGSNGFNHTLIPARVTDVVEIQSGEDFSLALKADGTVVGWGNSYSHTDQVPVGLTQVIQIAAGLQHALALKSDGSVVAWGETYTGPATLPANATQTAVIDANDAYSVVLRRAIESAPAVGQAYRFTPLAGLADTSGSTDGTGNNARFNRPVGIAVDGAGVVFVADANNRAIRKVTPDGVVTTLAEPIGQSGFTNGMANPGYFIYPTGVAVDNEGNISVADPGSSLVRRVTAAGVVSTLAGSPLHGFANGSGDAARFDVPVGVALDGAGNLYVTDTDIVLSANSDNNTIRKISPAGIVTTLAGTAGEYGSADGVGAAARFKLGSYGGFSGIAVDRRDNVYVADYGNSTIRKITPDGVVTTLAGEAGSRSMVDGKGSAARFAFLWDGGGVAVDGSGNVFVTDTGRIRRISPDGTVTTLRDPSGRFVYIPSNLRGIAVNDAGHLYLSAGNAILLGVPSVEPLALTKSHTIAQGGTVALTVDASVSSLSTFQWTKDGTALPGATQATLVISGASAVHTGNYECIVTDGQGSFSSGATTLMISSTAAVGRIVNLSTRAPAGTGSQTLILGTVIRGSAANTTKPVLFRAVGPSLAAFDVPGFIADPKLELVSGGTKINENDNWAGDSQVATIGSGVGAFPLGGTTSKDAALYQPSVAPGVYTMLVTGGGGTTGVALGEIYDATPSGAWSSATPRLVNASARAQVGTGSGVLIVGFVIGGETSKTLLIRAVGPSLAALGVTDVLADPILQLYSGSSRLRENDNWNADTAANTAAFARVGAFTLPLDSKDAALLVTLPPGVYTAHVNGVNSSTGVALVELYEVP